MNRCQMVGCYGQWRKITKMNLNMNLCPEYQSEWIFIFFTNIQILLLFTKKISVHYVYQYKEKFSWNNFSKKKCRGKLVTVTNQPVPRLPLTFYPCPQEKNFFSSTSWKYKQLPIWLKFLNPKHYPKKYLYRKDG